MPISVKALFHINTITILIYHIFLSNQLDYINSSKLGQTGNLPVIQKMKQRQHIQDSRTCSGSCRTAIPARAGTAPKCRPPSRDCCNTDKCSPGAHQHSLLLPATPTTSPTSPRTAETLNCPLTQHFSSIYPKCTTPLSQCHPNT